MAKTIKANPILTDEDARYFYDKFVKNSTIDQKKINRNKRCVTLFKNTPVK